MVMKKLALAGSAAALVCLMNSNAEASLIGGIEFPDGAISFADEVVSYTPGADVGNQWLLSDSSLGVPDYDGTNGAVSLGNDGELIVKFTDNSLTTSGNSNKDIHIFEVGGVTEFFNLAISTDGINWIDLGNVLGQPTSVDIDGVAGVIAGTKYSYVRLRDVGPDQTGFPFGEADIDAIGAISSAAPVDEVPEPVTMSLLGLGLAGIVARRRARS